MIKLAITRNLTAQNSLVILIFLSLLFQIVLTVQMIFQTGDVFSANITPTHRGKIMIVLKTSNFLLKL